jgi:uncharacterized protein (TIGR00255 family)
MNSMTGFGSGRAESAELGSITIEIRSVNNRFLDLVMRMPPELSSFEPKARGLMQKRFTRGKVYINTRFEPIPGATERYELNAPLLAQLEKFCQDRGHAPNPETLLGIPGVVNIKSDESRLEELGQLYEKALKSAMNAFEKERQREGSQLRECLTEIFHAMGIHVEEIAGTRQQVVEKYSERLHERLEELLGPKGAALDPGRLEQEVAIFADKADINEEIQRLTAHLTRMEDLLKPDNRSAKGRALDFLNQEILRETNTIGSKARDLSITGHVLELKNLVENMKEQIANVE